MNYKVDCIIEHISKFITLSPRDIIATGTLAGVGTLSISDIIEIEID